MAYLQTLEGVPRFGEVSQERREAVRNAFDYFWKTHFDVLDPVERFYKTFMSLTLAYTDEEIRTLCDRPNLHPDAKKAWEYFEIQRGRERAAVQAAEAASAAEAARRKAEAQAEAEAERDALDERRRMEKEVIIMDPSGEVSQDVEEIKPEPQEGGISEEQIIQEAQTAINEGDNMEQEIQLQTQIITPGRDWTKIDETSNTISYEDENGDIHIVEKKKSGLGWLLAAAAAFWFFG